MTVGDIQQQVQLLTHHDNLDAYVIDWVNRTLQDIGTTALWSRNMRYCVGTHSASADAVSTNAIEKHPFTVVPANTAHNQEIIEFLGVDAVCYETTGASTYAATPATYYRPLVRRDHYGVLAQLHGKSVDDVIAASGSSMYAVVGGGGTTSGGTVSQYVVGYPLPTTAVATLSTQLAMRIQYLESPTLMTTAASFHWIMSMYPRLVLSGVLMRARLYLRDGRGYLIEKAEYSNALADMILAEENMSANKPYMRAVQSDETNRRL